MVFSFGLFVSGALFLISLLIRKSLLKLIFFKVFYFTLFAYPFRFLLEKMLKWSVGTGLQILDITNHLKGRELTNRETSIGLVSLSFLILFVIFSLLLVVIALILKYYMRLTSPLFPLTPMVYGIKVTWRIWPFLYFLHFLSMRLFITFFIVISPFSSSKSMIGSILVVQLMSLILHILKMYRRWVLYFYALIREITLLFCLCFMFYL